MAELPRVVVVVGPTASGKTQLGITLARSHEGEVISADSRTIYRGMDIGTAKPEGLRKMGGESLEDLVKEKPLLVDGVAHWGFDLCNPDEIFTASDFQAYADAKIDDMDRRGKLPFLVGGTGLYIAAVIDRPSFGAAPPDPGLRRELLEKTNEELLEEIAERDPDTAEKIDVHNRRRLERAIEILRVTGRRLAEVQTRNPERYHSLFLGIDKEKTLSDASIDERVDLMIARGLVDEVRNLRDRYGDDAPGMTGIGYRQICAFLRKEVSLKDAILQIKRDSRQYAKRQRTWFRRDPRITWVANAYEADVLLEKFLTTAYVG